MVVIDIDRYTAGSNLGNAVNDAHGTADAFRKLGSIEHPGQFDEATIRNALHALVTDNLRMLGVEDSLVVFVASHGARLPQGCDPVGNPRMTRIDAAMIDFLVDHRTIGDCFRFGDYAVVRAVQTICFHNEVCNGCPD